MVRCSLGLALCGAATAYYFDGLGQLRAFQPVASTPPTGDIGCLTDVGSWTDMESECGNFTSVRNYDTTPNALSISSSKGPCGILENSTFVCGTSTAADTHLFTVRYLRLSINHELLRNAY